MSKSLVQCDGGRPQVEGEAHDLIYACWLTCDQRILLVPGVLMVFCTETMLIARIYVLWGLKKKIL
ncbi:hypothetical protein CONPUDRAFT_78647, partial [Coniophora puteana RWD-64-598 SS2]